MHFQVPEPWSKLTPKDKYVLIPIALSNAVGCPKNSYTVVLICMYVHCIFCCFLLQHFARRVVSMDAALLLTIALVILLGLETHVTMVMTSTWIPCSL